MNRSSLLGAGALPPSPPVQGMPAFFQVLKPASFLTAQGEVSMQAIGQAPTFEGAMAMVQHLKLTDFSILACIPILTRVASQLPVGGTQQQGNA